MDNIGIPIVTGAITWAGTQIDDNIIAIAGISSVLVVAMICRPFDEPNMFALTMTGLGSIAALAGYEIGKRATSQKG